MLSYVKRQMKDEYARLARLHSYRARSAFKLLELQRKFHIVKPGTLYTFQVVRQQASHACFRRRRVRCGCGAGIVESSAQRVALSRQGG